MNVCDAATDRRESTEFSIRLTRSVIENLTNMYGSENWDVARFGRRRMSLKRHLFEAFARAANRLLRSSRVRVVELSDTAQRTESFMRSHGPGIAELYALLDDEPSRRMLVDVMAYQLLGYRHMKLPANTPQRRDHIKKTASLVTGDEGIRIGFRGWKLDLFDLTEIGLPMKVYSRPSEIAVTFLFRHHAYDQVTPAIGPEPGDIVIDGGAAWGDTALLFAFLVGQHGRVISFEFEPNNLSVLRRVLDLNPELRARIEVVEKALWNTSGETLLFSCNGLATAVREADGGDSHCSVTTATIDEVCKGLPRVDFIKMDIEGAELQALQGAAETITRHRPKLAISLYHSLDDFVMVPRFLSELGLEYRYYLSHLTIHREETILFAAESHLD